MPSRTTACIRESYLTIKQLWYNYCTTIAQLLFNRDATIVQLCKKVYIYIYLYIYKGIPLTFSLISVARLLQTPETIAQQLHDCCAIITPIGDSTEAKTIRESIRKLAATENRQKKYACIQLFRSIISCTTLRFPQNSESNQFANWLRLKTGKKNMHAFNFLGP